MEITLTTPDPESFIPGSTISIGSSWTVADGWDVIARNGGFTLFSSGEFGFTADAGGEICFIDCDDFNFFPDIEIEDTEAEFFSFDVLDDLQHTIECDLTDFDAIFDPEEDMPCDPISFFAKTYGISGSFGLSNPDPVASLDGTTLSATGTAHYVDLDVDLDHLAIKFYVDSKAKACLKTATTTSAKAGCRAAKIAAMEALKLEATRTVNSASVYYNVLDLKFNIDAYQTKTFEFSATPQVTLPLGQAMDWEISDEEGNVVDSGRSSTVVFDAGHQVALTMPSDLSGNLTFTPSFDLTQNEITADFDNYLDTGYTFDALNLEASVPSYEIFPEFCDPTEIFGCTDPVISPAIEIPEVGPLLESQNTLVSLDVGSLEPQDSPWTLGGFSSSTGASFILNPELYPNASIRGDNSRKEGQKGDWHANNSSDPDGDDLTFEWDFGDGTISTGNEVSHTYADNGSYVITLTATDIHGLSDTATKTVTVTNVNPVADAGSKKRVNEGSQVGLGIDLYGRNLVSNPGAQSNSGWTNFNRASYGAEGSATPHTVTLIDNRDLDTSVTSYYRGNIARMLNGSNDTIPGAWATLYDGYDFDGNSRKVFTGDTCLHGTTGTDSDKGNNDPQDYWVGTSDIIGNDISSIRLGKDTVATFRENCTGSAFGAYDFEFRFGFDGEGDINTSTTSQSLTKGLFDEKLSTAKSDDAWLWDSSSPPQTFSSYGQIGSWISSFLNYDHYLLDRDRGCLTNNYFTGNDGSVLNDNISSLNLAANTTATFSRHCSSGGSSNFTIKFLNGPDPSFINLADFNPHNKISSMTMSWAGTLATNNNAPAPVFTDEVEDRLGDWIDSPSDVIGDWVQQLVPNSWTKDYENAVIYKILVPEGGMTNARLRITGEDGAFVWLDGSYKGGAVNESGIDKVFNLGSLAKGTRYLQILRTSTVNTNSPSWTIKLTATSPGGMPASDSPGSPTRGSKFFQGANSDKTMRQDIDVSEGIDQIDAEKVTFDLSAYLGGFYNQTDDAEVTITFHRGNGNQIGSAVTIGPVSKSDRGDVTGMLLREGTGDVPRLTREIRISLFLDEKDPARNDGYADDISLVLFANGEASFTDKGILDTHTATVDWRDGGGASPVTLTEANGDGTAQGSHIYGDNGSYTVKLKVTDKDGGNDSDTFKVTVDNVPPTVTPTDATFTDELSQTRVLATFTDPGFLDTHSVSIDWGDGHAHNGSGSVSESDGSGTVSGTHSFNVPDNSPFPVTRTIVVCVSDDDDGETCVTSDVTIVALYIDNVQASSPDKTKKENANLTLRGSAGALIDPSGTPPGHNRSYKWEYGDGSSSNWAPYTGGTVSKNHRYRDNGVYTARFLVRAIKNSGGALLAESEDSITVTISNDNPNVGSINTVDTREGDSVSISDETFTDDGPDDTHTAVVDWGDGNLTEATVDQDDRTAGASHVYDDNGTYIARLIVTDDDGGSGGRNFTVNVSNRPPNAQINADSPAEEGGNFTVRMINPSDPSVVDEAAGFTYSFDCADGSGFSVPSPSNSIECSADDEGTKRVKGRVWDKNDAHRERATNVTVNGVPPTANLIAPAEVNEGDAVWLSLASAHDPSEADTIAGFSYRFSCDGGANFSALSPANSSSCETDDGNSVLSIVAEVSDEDGLSTEYSASVAVNNVPPSGTFDAPTLVDEGTVYALALNDVSDPSDADTAAGFEYRFKCDSAPFTAFGTLAGTECTAGDDGAYTVTGKVRDVGLGLSRVSTYSTSVTVVNVAPVIDDIANTTVDEGSLLSIPGGFTDPGPDTWTATVDYGDGTGEQALALSGHTFTLAHTYAAFGTYVVEVTVDDDDTGGDSEWFTVSVRNIAPVTTIDGVTNGRLAAIAEGDLLTGSGYFADPGDNTWTATVSYGDGTPTTALPLNNDKTFDLEHVYADNGSYNVIVCVTDNGGALGCDWVIQDVTNAGPAVEAGEDQIVTEGDLVSLDPAGFHDQGSTDSHTAAIDWGDGEPIDDGAVTEAPFGPPGSVAGADGTVAGSHVFVDNGVYTVQVCVTDDDLAATCDELTVTVLNANPVVDAGADITTVEGQEFDPDDSFTDASVVDTHTGSIDWGDGTSGPAAVVQGAGSGNTISSHEYLVEGIYTVQVCITDDDGGSGCDTKVVTVITPFAMRELAVRSLASLGSISGEVSKALDLIAESLEDYWIDGSHLDPKDGEKVFGYEKSAMSELMNAIEHRDQDGLSDEDVAVILAAIDALIAGDIHLAETALTEAAAITGLNSGQQDKVDEEIAKGYEELAKGHEEMADGYPDKAVDQYMKAWSQAMKAFDEAND